MKRIGFFISETKIKKMDFVSRLKECTRDHDFEIIKIDLNLALEDQGPFDLIIHKLTDIHVLAKTGHQHSQMLFHNFQTYITGHPEIIVLNSITSVVNIIDRTLQYQLIANSVATGPESRLFIPAFIEITSNDVNDSRTKLREANIPYPIICKPVNAQGTNFCHEMSLIFNDEGLKDLKPPCVLQTFINHGGVLFKGYFIGDFIYIVRRPSLQNLTAGNFPTITFNSHHISKPDSNHYLILSDDKHDVTDLSTSRLEEVDLMPIMRSMRHILNLDLFGVDVISEPDTGRYAIVDVNIFPGYEGVPLFMEKLVEYIDSLLHKRDKVSRPAQSTDLHNANDANYSNSKKPKIMPAASKQRNPQTSLENGGGNSIVTSYDGNASTKAATVYCNATSDISYKLKQSNDSLGANLQRFTRCEQKDQQNLSRRQCHEDMVNVLQ